MSGLAAINLTCLMSLVVAFGAQLFLWIWFNEDTFKLLESIKQFKEVKSLPSNAQKFAVFLATSKARVWDSLMRQLGKTLSFASVAPGSFNLLVQLNNNGDFQTYLNESRPLLYLSVSMQVVCLLVLFYISLNVARFRKTFSVS